MMILFKLIFIHLTILSCAIAEWMETSVSLALNETTINEAFFLYSDLTKQPTWSPWITSVEILDKSTGLSKWKLKKLGLTYSWLAKNVECVNINKHMNVLSICWESIDGLPNKGHAEFYVDNVNNNMMKLTVSYKLPAIASFVIKRLGLYAERFIENMLLQDLIRFNKKLIENKNNITCKKE